MPDRPDVDVPWQTVRVVAVTVGLVLAGGGLFYLGASNSSIVYAGLVGGAVVLGYLGAVIFVYGLAPALTFGGLNGKIAWLLWTLAVLPWSKVVLERLPDGEWRLVDGSDIDGPPAAWTRFAFSRFAIGYPRDEAHFEGVETDAAAAETSAARRVATDGGDDFLLSQMDRGGERFFVERSVLDSDAITVALPAALARLRHSAGLFGLFDAEEEALEDHGGDQGEMGQPVMLIGMILFLLAGLGAGWVIAF